MDRDDAVGRRVEQLAHLGRDELARRVHDGAARDRAPEQARVPERVGGAELREPQEGHVVHGDHHRRPGRRGHEVGGVDDVDRTGPVLGAGPGQPALPELAHDAGGDRTGRSPGSPGGTLAGEGVAAAPA